jgi:hypothetical protein
MMMNRPLRRLDVLLRLVTLLLCAALAACSAPRHWSRAGTTEAEFNRDSHECARESPGFKIKTWPAMTAGASSTVDKDL